MARAARATTRARARARLLADASRVELPGRCDVAVLGGGAAGLACAITAAEQGASVVVLERAPECGRTILATGNGRCNLCNAELSPGRYNDPAFVGAVLGEGAAARVLSFFRDCGLATCEEAGGRLYPASLVAASVRDVLLARARRAGVVLACARQASSVDARTAGDVAVRYAELWEGGRHRSLPCARLVVATGGTSAEAVAGLGVEPIPARPVLCPIACTCGLGGLSALDGRRARCEAALLRDGREIRRMRGEVLFRPYGISGILAFDLSRVAGPGDAVVLDLAPDVPAAELAGLVRAAGSLAGALDPVLAAWLADACGADADALAASAKGLALEVAGTAEESRAQVLRGGLPTSAFEAPALRLGRDPRILACGEALDVDGDCGGFNLGWAWASGIAAGRSAAEGIS